MNSNLFDISGQVAVITGGTGVLGGSIAKHFLQAGVKVVVLGVREENLNKKVAEFSQFGEVLGFTCDVLNMDRLQYVRDQIIAKWGTIDILVNVAGGNIPEATIADNITVFDMTEDALKRVTDLNMNGTVLPTLVFGETIAKSGKGSIINISSMATYTALSRVMGYGLAKTAINNFTQWMAMEMATKFSDKVRVNAIAPGFFIGDQNRAMLINPDGSLTERSKKVIAKTPMKRFGEISELNGIVQFLCSDAASFITGTIIPVDGGFSSFSGV